MTELNTEFLIDFNCELNKKSRDDWKLLSSDHRHDARRSSRQYTETSLNVSIERKFEQNEERISDVSIGFPSLKLRECSNGLS